MPAAPLKDLEKVNVILTKDQVRRLRQMQSEATSPLIRISLSDITRQVVEAGLEVISDESNSSNTATAIASGASQ